ncbi:dolichyl-diphosphooligosaccharide-protein glycotransferase [Tieghemostelium lacteum]|uniref:Ribophorin II n=1 Tax=Tieghemostelium lacteum TaxID=361077 RepID=A0A151ZGX2_TIELA|nr:dolichyl-diphosphooligosaccharide-protein glycotransferase [Tieghemostelium lacteum]|eukprot:KYQ93216.1 dolichyl-diphosphooligosaccharide-protein glycotransferase [Tieghemostelium lacteum]
MIYISKINIKNTKIKTKCTDKLLSIFIVIGIIVGCSIAESTTTTIKDFKITVGESKETLGNSKLVYEVAYGKKLSSSVDIPSNNVAKVVYKVNSNDKALVAQQASIRLYSLDGIDITIPMSYAQSEYSYTLSYKEIAKAFKSHSAEYTLEVIVSDSQLSTPIQWSVGTIKLNFAVQQSSPLSRYPEQKVISHLFRVPEARPSQTISTAFTGLVLAPSAIFVFGMLALGFNLSRFPTGMTFIYCTAFLASITAVTLLIIQYWISLTMVVTLRYLAVLLIPTLFFGQKTLSYLNSERPQLTKEKTN